MRILFKNKYFEPLGKPDQDRYIFVISCFVLLLRTSRRFKGLTLYSPSILNLQKLERENYLLIVAWQKFKGSSFLHYDQNWACKQT